MAKQNNFQNYELNIYKINSEKKLDSYLAEFLRINKDIKHYNIIRNEDYDVLYFSYLNPIKDNEITWFKRWKDFFPEITTELINKSQTGHGLILIKLNKCNGLYAIVFGRAYPLIKNYIIDQFGMDMAARLFDGKSIDSASSKFFSLIKNKAMTSYYGDSTFQYGDNEAIDMFKADIVPYKHEEHNSLNDLILIIKSKIMVGIDNVKLTLRKDKVELNDLYVVCDHLENILNYYEERFNPPRMTPVKGEKIKELDMNMLNEILNDKDIINITVPIFSKDSNDEYVFLNNIEDFQFAIGRIKSEKFERLDKEKMFDFVKENKDSIKDLRHLKILIGDYEDLLIKWLDYQLDAGETTYALNNGRWYSFNKRYIENIHERIKEFEEDGIIQIDNNYSFNLQNEQEYLQNNREDIQSCYGEGDPYREFIYNHYLSQKNNFYLFDRVNFKDNIEVCDLYGNNTLFHCKIGNTRSLEECLRQSLYGLKYFFQKENDVKTKNNVKGQSIGNVTDIKVIYLKEQGDIVNFKVSKLRSLRAKQTFIDWVNICRQLNKKPKLIVAKYTNEDKTGGSI